METKVKNLIYSASRENKETRVNVTIAVRDGGTCQYFSITAEVYTRHNGRGPWPKNPTCCGCCHDQIAVFFPEFIPFINLHLCDLNGAPMYPVSNSRYYFKESRAKGTEYVRINPDDTRAGSLQAAAKEGPEFFAYVLETSGIMDQWKAEAGAALAELERLTGKQLEILPGRYYSPLSEEVRAEIKNRINSGYYSDEAREARNRAKEQAAREEARAAIVERYDAEIQKAQTDKNIHLLIFDMFGTDENIIVYNHSRKIELNWRHNENIKTWTRQEAHQIERAIKDGPAEFCDYTVTI